MSSSAAHASKQDCDCASMARAALFPKQIGRDGSHRTMFPALDALNVVRETAMAADPDRAGSSFFPKRVVVVRANVLGLQDESSAGASGSALQWNGQPDIDNKDATFEVIPAMLSVKCMECVNKKPKEKRSFIETIEGEKGKRIVLCSDRLVKNAAAAVEETLAHEITIVGEQLEYERKRAALVDDPSSTCKGMASSEVKAARAAECYYNKNGKEVRRGSCLPLGYSLLPNSLQRKLMERCVRSVATNAVAEKFGSGKAKECVNDATHQ